MPRWRRIGRVFGRVRPYTGGPPGSRSRSCGCRRCAARGRCTISFDCDFVIFEGIAEVALYVIAAPGRPFGGPGAEPRTPFWSNGCGGPAADGFSGFSGNDGDAKQR